MNVLTPYVIAAVWLVCAGVGRWLRDSREIHRLQSRRVFARRNVRRALAIAPVQGKLLLSHSVKFCPAELLNATQRF